MKKFIPIIVIAAVLLIGGALYFTRSNTDDSTTLPTTTQTDDSTPTGSTTSQDSTATTLDCPSPPANTVSYCKGKFNSLTVPAGTQVTFINNSNTSVQPSSDPHPQHTTNPELNVGFMNAGQSKTVTLNKKGAWGIHNHIREEEVATITVQ